MRPGDLVVCSSNGTRLRRHPADMRYDSSDADYWASKIEVDEVALVLDWRTGSTEVELYVLGPRGPGWIWEVSVQELNVLSDPCRVPGPDTPSPGR